MSIMKKAISGSIHRIREFELEKVNLSDEFDILQIVGEGWFGKILLTEHRSTQTEMVLKALPKAYTGITDFYREFHLGLHLSAHRNIITTYDIAFETAGFYIFSQEYAPLGDLASNVTETGLGERHAKRVARQLAAAVHHIHSRELVHRDIKLDNILIFKSDFSRIKLCDFGETRRTNTIVRRHNEWLPYSPPEVLQIDTDETYKAALSHDVWQFGIVLFVCLTGCIPWQKATPDDRRYTRYVNWHTATLHIAKKPKLFQLISSRAQRMFKRLLEPKLEKRPATVLEINKYLEDRWLAKLGAEKAVNGGADERDELSPSMYSFHSSMEEKNQLLYTLTQYGIETTVDRTRKKDRIREWIESSVITEENEERTGVDDNEKRDSVTEVDNVDGMADRHFQESRQSSSMVEPISLRSMSTSRELLVDSNNEYTGKLAQKTNNINSQDRRTNIILSTNRRAARSLKEMQKKSPFTPQVTPERRAVARFSSFPNGDPNMAIKNERSSNTSINASKLAIFPTEHELMTPCRSIVNNVQEFFDNEKSPISFETRKQGGLTELLRSSNDDVSFDANIRHDTSVCSDTIINDSNSQDVGSLSQIDLVYGQNRDEPGKSFRKYQLTLNSPQAPSRKHRSVHAQFLSPITTQQQLTNFQENTFLPDNPPTTGEPLATSSTVMQTKVPSQLISTIHDNNSSSNDKRDVNNSTTNCNFAIDRNALKMTIASHFPMQSSNAVQAVNTVPVAKMSISEQIPRTKGAANIRNTVSDVTSQTDETRVNTFRKDIYEQYNTFQRIGEIDKNDFEKPESSRSSSRSVST